MRIQGSQGPREIVRLSMHVLLKSKSGAKSLCLVPSRLGDWSRTINYIKHDTTESFYIIHCLHSVTSTSFGYYTSLIILNICKYIKPRGTSSNSGKKGSVNLVSKLKKHNKNKYLSNFLYRFYFLQNFISH